MRSTIFVILALLLTSGGFLAYHKFQKPIARLLGHGAPPDPQVLDPRAPTVGRVGQGERPFSRVFDKEGRLSSKFRAAEVQPRGSGRIHVVTVEAEFYQYLKPTQQSPKGRVQLIRIEGEDGDMEIQDTAEGSKGAMEKGSQAAPRRGRLNHVVMKLYRDFQDRQLELKQPGRGGPMLILTTNNISFDNELFEVATQSFKDADGNTVPADQVPIHVTGDYLFEGRGLKLRWNDIEGRLDYLDVANGEKLVVLHPRDLPGSGSEPDAPKQQKTAALTDANGEPIMLAAKDKTAAALAQPKEPPAARTAPARGNRSAARAPKHEPEKPDRHGPQPPYRATFIDDVHITQGHENVDEREVAVADLMHVDFQMGGSSKSTTQPSTRPTTFPTALAVAPAAAEATPGAPATTQPSDALAQAAPASTQPTTGPSTQPTSPEEEPVIVRWTGPLKMAPIEADTPNAPIGLKGGESVLHLLGTRAPVVLTRDANKVRCGSMDYYSADGSVSMHNSPLVPQIVLTQTAVPPSAPGAAPVPPDGQKGPKPGSGQDATIVTESLVYSGADHIAVLSGPGSAQVAMKSGASGAKEGRASDPAESGQPDQLDATWTRSARLYFAPGSKDAREGLTLDHATLLGDVDVVHPQLALRSQALDLLFERPPAQAGAAVTAIAPADATAAGASTQPAGALAHAKDKKEAQQPELRRIIASDRVWCDLKDDKGKRQTVLGDHLALETAHDKDGKLYPQLVNVDGNAHAFDATQDLKAGHIALTLVPSSKKPRPTTGPSTAPAGAETTGVALAKADPGAAAPTTHPAAGGLDTASVELETMTARDNVNALSADGATATGDELYVVMRDGQPNTRLIGRSAPAKVVDPKQNVVIGPVISFDGKQNVAAIEGQGHLHLMRQDDPADKPRPVDIAFVQGALVNSPANRVFVYGPVAVVTADADGTVTTLTGRNATIELADRPPPAPATQPAAHAVIASGPGVVNPGRADAVAAAATVPSTRPSKHHKDAGDGAPDGMKMDLMKDKDVRAVVFEQDAVVKSSLAAADGSILREFELKSSLIRYELIGGAPVRTMTAAGGAPSAGQKPHQLGKLIVPVPGTMLVRDHRPPEKRQAAAGGNAGGGLDAGNSRGAMAFQWDHDLVYDESTRAATMNGHVISVFQSDDPKEPRAQLNSDQVTALFEPKAPAPKPQPGAQQTPPVGQQAEAPASLQLRWLTALGHASVTRAGAVLTANRIDYDPLSSQLVATGADRDPAHYRDATGINATAAEQILWNTQTWLIKAHNFSARTAGAPEPKAAAAKQSPQQPRQQPQPQRRR